MSLGNGGYAHISQISSPKLKKCLNPDCDNYYYGDNRDRYCCIKCRVHASYLKSKKNGYLLGYRRQHLGIRSLRNFSCWFDRLESNDFRVVK